MNTNKIFAGFEGTQEDQVRILRCLMKEGVPVISFQRGKSDLESVYDFNTKAGVEGENNNYRIYRKPVITFDEIKKNFKLLTDTFSQENGWTIFSIKHVVQVDEYDTLKDAVMAAKGSSETADLNAYVSDAKAVLMSDAKTTVNTGDSTSPEPSDVQDPCDEYINLTINKVWKDFRNMDNIRPDTIKITISRSWTDAEGTKHTEVVPGYEIYVIKAINQNPHGRRLLSQKNRISYSRPIKKILTELCIITHIPLQKRK